jgi:hypothetical protein
MVIGPAAAFVPKGYKAIKRLLGGADEVVFQPKLPGTAQKKKKKSEPKKEQKIDKLSKKERQKEALENQGEFPQSPNQDRKSIGMSQKQYDDLIEGGWDHQKIMDEHEIVSNTKRREGAGPVRKVPKNPKPLTDEEYDLALGLEKDINKLLEVNELISQADETIDPKALAFYGIQPIKKMAKKIGWRGPVNEETKDAIFDLTIEKYNKLYDRAEVWNVDTHIWLENYITGTN